MNTKSIFALLPLDIKEIISDKLCEPDKQIHKILMEDLLWMNTEMMVERYRQNILETYNLIGDNYTESYEDCLVDMYQAKKELFDDIHTKVCNSLCPRSVAPTGWQSLGFRRSVFHSILPSLVKQWHSRNCPLITDDDGCPICIRHNNSYDRLFDWDSDSDSDSDSFFKRLIYI